MYKDSLLLLTILKLRLILAIEPIEDYITLLYLPYDLLTTLIL